MSEFEKVNTASCSEPEASSSKIMTKSELENQKTKVGNNSKSKAPELQILKRSEPNKQVLKKTEFESQKPRFQRKKLFVLRHNLRLKVLNLKSGRRQGRPISDREHKESSKLLGLTQEDPQRYGYLRQT